MLKGLIHVYCGEGKGKTTASVGLAVRCAGGGGKVIYASFMKDNKSGERKILESLENIELLENPDAVDFYKFMSEENKKIFNKYCLDKFEIITKKINSHPYDMLVLDEIIPVINYGIISESLILNMIENRPDKLEIVLTGRYPSESIINAADYVTEMKKIKHPYDNGINARKFIEM